MNYFTSAMSRNKLLSTDTRPTNIRRKDYIGSISKYYKPNKPAETFMLYTGKLEVLVYTSRAMTLVKDVVMKNSIAKLKVGDVIVFTENNDLVVLEVEAFSQSKKTLIYQPLTVGGKSKANVMAECSFRLSA
tara:strand:- start:1150 stop:1545 length:396 start_codon:yes stop_codon:yes gene_type:complete